MSDTYEWNVRPTVFETGVIAGLTAPKCMHCGRGPVPLILFGDQSHVADSAYALVCYECLQEATTLLGAA